MKLRLSMPSQQPALELTIIERDVDMLLIEEIASSHAIANLLLSKSFGAAGDAFGEFNVEKVKRSAYGEGRETDILVVASPREAPARKYMLLIEDKLSHSFSDRQPEAYEERARAAVERGEVEEAKTMLIAPRNVVELNPSATGIFDAVLTYEDIEDYFDRLKSTSRGLSARASHRSRFMRMAREGRAPNSSYNEIDEAMWNSPFIQALRSALEALGSVLSREYRRPMELGDPPLVKTQKKEGFSLRVYSGKVADPKNSLSFANLSGGREILNFSCQAWFDHYLAGHPATRQFRNFLESLLPESKMQKWLAPPQLDSRDDLIHFAVSIRLEVAMRHVDSIAQALCAFSKPHNSG